MMTKSKVWLKSVVFKESLFFHLRFYWVQQRKVQQLNNLTFKCLVFLWGNSQYSKLTATFWRSLSTWSEKALDLEQLSHSTNVIIWFSGTLSLKTMVNTKKSKATTKSTNPQQRRSTSLRLPPCTVRQPGVWGPRDRTKVPLPAPWCCPLDTSLTLLRSLPPRSPTCSNSWTPLSELSLSRDTRLLDKQYRLWMVPKPTCMDC